MSLKEKISSSSPLTKAVIWVLLMLLFGGIMLQGFKIWVAISGQQTLCHLKALQAAQAFFLFIFPALVAVSLWSYRPMSWLHLDRLFSWKEAVLIVGLIIAAIPGINLLSHLNQQVVLPSFLASLEAALQAQEAAAAALTEQFLQADNVGGFLLNLILMALLPAIGEEFCFRGVCQGLLENNDQTKAIGRSCLSGRTHVAIWVTAAVFSLFHFQFYGFVPRMLLGAMLGYLLVWTGSLWAPILAHFTNNAIAVLSYYICDHTDKINTESVDNFGFGDTLWAGLLSIVLAAGMLYLIFRERKGKNNS